MFLYAEYLKYLQRVPLGVSTKKVATSQFQRLSYGGFRYYRNSKSVLDNTQFYYVLVNRKKNAVCFCNLTLLLTISGYINLSRNSHNNLDSQIWKDCVAICRSVCKNELKNARPDVDLSLILYWLYCKCDCCFVV